MRCNGLLRSFLASGRRSITSELPRTDIQLEPKVDAELKNDIYKHKNHPGRNTGRVLHLPDQFCDASHNLLKEYPVNNLAKHAEKLSNQLLRREAPLEKRDYIEKYSKLKRQVLEENLEKFPEEPRLDSKKLHSAVLAKLHQTTYKWESINYDFYKGMLYLVGRSAPNYAILKTVLNEIKLGAPEFRPRAILDFGSGIATALWATRDTWKDDIKEYFAVDVSGDMNAIAQRLINDGQNQQVLTKRIFFRQFLPGLHTITYDLVISSYSLLELPSRSVRLQTIQNLWNKTADFLVIVENGSKVGHNLILEARDFILQTNEVNSHVFAPCTHDMPCPKMDHKIPCNFEANYFPLLGKEHRTERYSYVILRKQKRPEEEVWPRIISPVLLRPRHVVCRLCCSDGEIKEAVVTVSKHSKNLYKCARASRWGDQLPVSCQTNATIPDKSECTNG